MTVAAGGTKTAHIHLSSRGALPMSVPMRVTFTDGTTKDVRLPVDIWRRGSSYRYDLPVEHDVRSVEIDPDHNLPDVQRDNNVWRKSG